MPTGLSALSPSAGSLPLPFGPLIFEAENTEHSVKIVFAKVGAGCPCVFARRRFSSVGIARPLEGFQNQYQGQAMPTGLSALSPSAGSLPLPDCVQYFLLPLITAGLCLLPAASYQM